MEYTFFNTCRYEEKDFFYFLPVILLAPTEAFLLKLLSSLTRTFEAIPQLKTLYPLCNIYII